MNILINFFLSFIHENALNWTLMFLLCPERLYLHCHIRQNYGAVLQ